MDSFARHGATSKNIGTATPICSLVHLLLERNCLNCTETHSVSASHSPDKQASD